VKHYKQWRFCQFLECQAARTNANPPYWKLSGDGFFYRTYDWANV